MIEDSDTFAEPVLDSSVEVLQLEFNGNPRAIELFQWFFEAATYSRPFVLHLLETARGKRGDSWDVRRFATRMLQEHLLSMDANDVREFGIVFGQLNPDLVLEKNAKLPKSVLNEGYSTLDAPGFIKQFRRRLMRPRCPVSPRRKRPVTKTGVRELVEQSRQECKLALGRYVFSPDEVVARIHEQVKVLTGLPVAGDDGLALDEAQRAVLDLPEYEAAILRKLRAGAPVYWVADDTPSKLNSMVEYPPGTVVLVVKPPGSHVEFEFKRAGRRGDHPLSAASHVPPSHRLDGGSMLASLQWDARNSAVLSHVYRHVHDQPAPLSRIVQTIGKYQVPLRNGDRPFIEYLTNREIYGEGYDAMRKAMAIVVACFRKERGNSIQPIPGEFGLTMQFVLFTGPAQAILYGSSSFRLDLLAKYLSADGPVEYFTRGLQIDYQDFDAKLLADVLLDEALGVYHPPAVEYRDYNQYVAAAFAVPRNRAKANATYRDLLKQIGTLWGTLLAVRGYSFGESFVARNVGLRTIWRRGQWCARLVFQDHDNLVLPDGSQTEYWPMTALPPTKLDDLYINGRGGSDNLAFESNCLQRIYRVDEALREQGRKRLHNAMKRAYVKTQRAMQTDPRVQSRFDKRFIERLRDWDAVARIYLARNGSSNDEDWKSRVPTFLRKRGYGEGSIKEHCRALEEHGSFVESHSFLYRARTGDP